MICTLVLVSYINGHYYNNYIYSMAPSCPFDVACTIFKPYISQPQFIHRLKSGKVVGNGVSICIHYSYNDVISAKHGCFASSLWHGSGNMPTTFIVYCISMLS